MMPLPDLATAPLAPEKLTMLPETFKSDAPVPRSTTNAVGLPPLSRTLIFLISDALSAALTWKTVSVQTSMAPLPVTTSLSSIPPAIATVIFLNVWFLVSFRNSVPPLISTFPTQASFPELPKQSTPRRATAPPRLITKSPRMMPSSPPEIRNSVPALTVVPPV